MGCCWQSFDQELSKLVASKGIYKLTFPFDKVDELRFVLQQKNINDMFLKPSFANVAGRVRRAFVDNERYPRQSTQG